jgi:ribosome-binding factor A
LSRRTEMLGSTIQRELASIIMRQLNDPRLTGLPSITRVKVSGDLSIADVFVTVMGTPGQQNAAVEALRHSASLMRANLSKSLSLRVTPFLKFHLDENLKKEIAILEALRKVSEENAELDRRRAEANSAGAEADSSGVETEPVGAEAQSSVSEAPSSVSNGALPGETPADEESETTDS